MYNTDLLDEIFIKPAAEIKQDRFAETRAEASCSGECTAGMCKTLMQD
ncbi:MAG: hypothetical protein JO149_02685 [Gammaproteobacteria bacterium]|nr:hypothetical protein [Gammaproteobacteria bacterium]